MGTLAVARLNPTAAQRTGARKKFAGHLTNVRSPDAKKPASCGLGGTGKGLLET